MSGHIKHYCNTCSRYYKSRQSLYNHNRKFHTKNKSIISQPLVDDKPNVNQISATIKVYACSYCNNIYKHNQSKWKHEKKCKNNLKIKNINLEKENHELKEMFEKEIALLKDQLLDIMNKNCKMHPKTLQKINRQLNQNNTNCVVNNNIINIIPLGQENLTDILSKKEQKMILNKKQQSLNYLIEYVHFNKKYPQFQNIIVTNLKDNIAYKYDINMNKFIATSKDELLQILLENRIIDIEDFYNFNSDKLNHNTNTVLNNFINKIKNDDEYFYKKKNDIKLILYNNSDIKKLL